MFPRKELRIRVMSRLYRVVMALLLLAEVSSFGEETSNPGIVARITREGLEYAHRHGVATLKNERSNIKLPDFSGLFSFSWLGEVSYDFHSLKIHHFVVQHSELELLPQRGVGAFLFNDYVSLSGMWKVKKAFMSLAGSFDLSVDGIIMSVSLNLGKDHFGRPTASVGHCSSSIGRVSIDISGNLSWMLNLFQERIEKNLKNMLEQKICNVVRKAVTSRLQPYLQTLPVTWMIDEVAGIDYRLVGAPLVSSQSLDMLFKGEFFNRRQRSPIPFEAPAIMLPQKHDRMIYFAVSEYVFNTASWVYCQNKRMNFIIRNEHLMNLTKLSNHQSAKKWRKQHSNPSCLSQANAPLTTTLSCFSNSFLLLLLQFPLNSPMSLHTSSFRVLIPKLARLYPNMEMELEVSPESAPFLILTPGNVTIMAVVDIQAFALLPKSSDRMPLFQLRGRTNISITIDVSSSRIFGSMTTGSTLKLELKQSNVGVFNVQLMETIFNYYAQHTIYPSLNAKLEEGFPLPLPRDIYLNSLVLQIHKNFLLFGANID
ncbi:lipopolysaccharide-binding protein-like [Choloepus didactylus]|uniref:lipopolysaccharide-binding protein-like n=1 Tax=Choloepus didactylus TaxID=27675 RepID=UPI0018A0E18E|nr:lipopolysaccharide-binding protein-like [Choloepus didactylus]